MDTWQPSPLSSAGRRLSVRGGAGRGAAAGGRAGDDRRGARPARRRRRRWQRPRAQRQLGTGGSVRRAQRPAQPGSEASTWCGCAPPRRARSICASASPTSSSAGGSGSRSPTGAAAAAGRTPLPDPPTPTSTAFEQERHQATVEVTENFRMPLLPVYATPVGTRDIGDDWLYDSERQLIFSRRDDSRDMTLLLRLPAHHLHPAGAARAPPLPVATTRPGSRPSSRRCRRSTSWSTGADRGRAHRLRQGAGDLRPLLLRQRLPVPPQHGERHQRRGDRRLPHQQGRLLPAVRRGDGVAGPRRRHPGPRRLRLHPAAAPTATARTR